MKWRYEGNFVKPVFRHEMENHQITGTQGVSEHQSWLSTSTAKEKKIPLQSWAALQFNSCNSEFFMVMLDSNYFSVLHNKLVH